MFNDNKQKNRNAYEVRVIMINIINYLKNNFFVQDFSNLLNFFNILNK